MSCYVYSIHPDSYESDEDGWWELAAKIYKLMKLNCIVGDGWSLSYQVFNNSRDNAKTEKGFWFNYVFSV